MANGIWRTPATSISAHTMSPRTKMRHFAPFARSLLRRIGFPNRHSFDDFGGNSERIANIGDHAINRCAEHCEEQKRTPKECSAGEAGKPNFNATKMTNGTNSTRNGHAQLHACHMAMPIQAYHLPPTARNEEAMDAGRLRYTSDMAKQVAACVTQ